MTSSRLPCLRRLASTRRSSCRTGLGPDPFPRSSSRAGGNPGFLPYRTGPASLCGGRRHSWGRVPAVPGVFLQRPGALRGSGGSCRTGLGPNPFPGNASRAGGDPGFLPHRTGPASLCGGRGRSWGRVPAVPRFFLQRHRAWGGHGGSSCTGLAPGRCFRYLSLRGRLRLGTACRPSGSSIGPCAGPALRGVISA